MKQKNGKSNVVERLKKQKLLFLMLLPGLLLTFIFKYVPMYGILIAFKDYNPLLGILKSPWIARIPPISFFP